VSPQTFALRFVTSPSTCLIVADDARVMLANVGSRFDFHMAKTLCDLRSTRVSFGKRTDSSIF